ncbi:hypothetical protein JDM601_3289 [Mycolicibacter sinensis]|uniref:Uncharacterized protein n=1 Tax=Mycolicibacter sinensis (strain JDM601) TaxID=875328 RepID=F5YXT5_MYCSD|nr:hypothetical protein JDM601_3289 [Mycolicibacter sinensis]
MQPAVREGEHRQHAVAVEEVAELLAPGIELPGSVAVQRAMQIGGSSPS